MWPLEDPLLNGRAVAAGGLNVAEGEKVMVSKCEHAVVELCSSFG